MHRRTSQLACIVALMLAVSACGGSGLRPSNHRSSDNRSSHNKVTQSPIPKLTNDAERARYALLPREAIPAKVKQLLNVRNRATCSPRVLFKRDVTAMATTPRFVIKDGAVQQTVALFRDDRAAKRAFDRLDSNANRRCIVQYTHEIITERAGRPIPPLTSRIITVEPFGQQSTAYRLEVSAWNETVGTDILLNRFRRGISSVSLEWQVFPGDLVFQEKLVANIAMRMQRALPATRSPRHAKPM